MICAMSLQTLADNCGGQLYGADVEFDQLAIDSRQLKRGDLFLGIDGENHKGVSFALDATKAGASALVVSEQVQVSSVSQVVVGDTRKALAEVARHCRTHFGNPVVAITGSAGKTTTRKMLGAIIAQKSSVCMTQGNQNNEVGVPLTLLRLSDKDSAAVIEMGARHIGDIAYLCDFTQPNVSVLLNAGLAHIGEFGSYENIVATKGEIYCALGKTGTAVVNLDDPACHTWLSEIGSRRVLSYSSEGKGAAVRGVDARCDKNGISFTLVIEQEAVAVSMKALGLRNVSNALAAAAAAHAIGLPVEQIAQGLAAFRAEAGRLDLKHLDNGMTVIDDTYNANPVSMQAALKVLESFEGKRIAIIGEMGELGDEAEQMHYELAHFAAGLDLNEIWIIGPFSLGMTEIIGARAKSFADKAQIIAALRQENTEELCVLLKASRSGALEDVLSGYQEGSSACFIG